MGSISDTQTQPLLLIDDDRTFSDFVATSLRSAGLATHVAHSGHAGIDAVAHRRHSLVLLDLVLPDLDGLEVLRRLKAMTHSPPVILISGLGTIQSAVEAIRLGALDFVEKPVMVADLVDTIRSHLPAPATEPFNDDSALHDLVRWVMAVVRARTDTRTIDEWARRSGSSSATIFARCARTDLKAKALLDLGRLLRITLMPLPRPPAIADALRTRDIRTVGALLNRAGVSRSDLDRVDQAQLLANQQLVRNSLFLTLLSASLIATAQKESGNPHEPT